MIATVRRHYASVAIGVAVFAPLLLGAVLVPFRGTFAGTAAALSMVVVILGIAVAGTRPAGVIASLSAALWFDFFLTNPYDRFAISHRPDVETTVAIFVVGVVVTELAARSRHHWRAAASSTTYVEMIHALAVRGADAAPPDELIERASTSLSELLSLRACRFDKLLCDPPLARIESDGSIVHVGLRWPVHEIGIPGPESEIVAQWRGRVIGRFVLTPTAGQPVTLEQRIVAVALVDVIAAYLVDERHAH